MKGTAAHRYAALAINDTWSPTKSHDRSITKQGAEDMNDFDDEQDGPVFEFEIPDFDAPGADLRQAVAVGVYAAFGDPAEGAVDVDGNLDQAHIIERVTAWLSHKYPYMAEIVDHEMRSAGGKVEYRAVSPWVEMPS